MFRLNRALRAALPFEPTALTTLDALEARLAANSPLPVVGNRSSLSHSRLSLELDLQDSYKWFNSRYTGAPFFISPKHDGIRMVSYVAPIPHQAPSGTTRRPSKADAATKGAHQPVKPFSFSPSATTTYSRHGRPLYGMFWIEKELALLRALAMDPALTLDGELYIHRRARPANSPTSESTVAQAVNESRVAATLKRRKGCSPRALGDDFKTGFLAVSALCHRLRGSKSQCATVQDILQYVAALPHYCLFDVAAYAPPVLVDHAALDLHSNYPKDASAELLRIWGETLASVGLRDAEGLRCVPNVTAFSQRIRTLHFLMELLARGCESPVLQRTFGVRQKAEVAASSGVSSQEGCEAKGHSKKQSGGNQVGAAAPVSVPCRYRGGVFVKSIPYQITNSLEVAKTRLLPLYERNGYEGAVIRTPTNTYAMREKRKGVVRALVASMADLPQTLPAPAMANESGLLLRHRVAGEKIFNVTPDGQVAGQSPRTLLRTYVDDSNKRAPRALVKGNKDKELLAAAPGCVEGDVVPDNSAYIAHLAVDRARRLPRRCETAVKLLPFKDKEYPVLRPLLKEPSSNPRTRPLLTVPISVVCPDGDRSLIKPDLTKCTVSSTSVKKSRAAPKVRKNVGEEDVVVFYGLQCLAENGRVFNVTMPKLTHSQQRELLHHLLTSTQRKGSMARGGHRSGTKSLTGTYVTVKFASLTEHGVPRFGQVKAIRGGKGWHL